MREVPHRGRGYITTRSLSPGTTVLRTSGYVFSQAQWEQSTFSKNNQGWSLFLLDQLLTQSNNAAAEFIEEVLHQLSPFSLDEKLKSCYKPQLEEAVSLAKLYYNLHEKNSKPHCQKQLVNNNGLEGKDLEFSPKLSFTGNLPCVPTSRLSKEYEDNQQRTQANRIQTLTRLLLILLTNMHGNGGEICGLFPKAAFFNHSCWPNVIFAIDVANGCIEIRTITQVQPGEELCHTYTNLTGSKSSRREKLQSQYGFECQCQRCTDSSSTGWHIDQLLEAVLCEGTNKQICKDYLFRVDEGLYCCRSCGKMKTDDEINMLLQPIYAEYENGMQCLFHGQFVSSVAHLEKALAAATSNLHSCHWLRFEILLRLATALKYMGESSKLANVLSHAFASCSLLLPRNHRLKVDLCHDLSQVAKEEKQRIHFRQLADSISQICFGRCDEKLTGNLQF